MEIAKLEQHENLSCKNIYISVFVQKSDLSNLLEFLMLLIEVLLQAISF